MGKTANFDGHTFRSNYYLKWICILAMAAILIMSFGTKEVDAASKKVPERVTISSVKVSGTNKIVIKWKKTKNANKYRVYYRKSGSKKWIKVVDTPKTSYVHKSSKRMVLNANTKYQYCVKAYNTKSRKWSKLSKVMTVKTTKAKAAATPKPTTAPAAIPTSKPTTNPIAIPTSRPTGIPEPDQTSSIPSNFEKKYDCSGKAIAVYYNGTWYGTNESFLADDGWYYYINEYGTIQGSSEDPNAPRDAYIWYNGELITMTEYKKRKAEEEAEKKRVEQNRQNTYKAWLKADAAKYLKITSDMTIDEKCKTILAHMEEYWVYGDCKGGLYDYKCSTPEYCFSREMADKEEVPYHAVDCKGAAVLFHDYAELFGIECKYGSIFDTNIYDDMPSTPGGHTFNYVYYDGSWYHRYDMLPVAYNSGVHYTFGHLYDESMGGISTWRSQLKAKQVTGYAYNDKSRDDN